MGFEIPICLFSIDAVTFLPIDCGIKTFLDKSLLDSINFSAPRCLVWVAE
jgi:hypothetical protein